MPDVAHSPEDLKQLYQARFAGAGDYRRKVWNVLCGFFEQWIPRHGAVLDLGCGYCEFINAVNCHRKLAMDLNPDAALYADKNVTVLEQDCSLPWQVQPGTLDAVFTSNFFEHLPTKASLESTLQQVNRALKPAGRLIAMGPNVRLVPGAYWDFFDHYLPLTERSLAEVLKKVGFEIEVCRSKFMPYTMARKSKYPAFALKVYLAFPVAWRFFGKQFLVVARKKS